MEDALIVIGMSSVALLWIFSIAGALATVWDTVDDHLGALLKRFRRFKG